MGKATDMPVQCFAFIKLYLRNMFGGTLEVAGSMGNLKCSSLKLYKQDTGEAVA